MGKLALRGELVIRGQLSIRGQSANWHELLTFCSSTYCDQRQIPGDVMGMEPHAEAWQRLIAAPLLAVRLTPELLPPDRAPRDPGSRRSTLAVCPGAPARSSPCSRQYGPPEVE